MSRDTSSATFATSSFKTRSRRGFYGPVVPCVYDKYKTYGNRQIEPREADGLVEFQKDEERELFEQVYYVHSVYLAIGLMRMTHCEAPWKNAGCKRNEVIEPCACPQSWRRSALRLCRNAQGEAKHERGECVAEAVDGNYFA